MSASCPKVSFALPSVSRECGRLCVPWLKTKTGVPTKFFEEPNFDASAVVCGGGYLRVDAKYDIISARLRKGEQ